MKKELHVLVRLKCCLEIFQNACSKCVGAERLSKSSGRER